MSSPELADSLRSQPARILGFRIFPFASADDLIDQVGGNTGLLLALNAEKLAQGDDRIRAVAAVSVGYADGYGAVLALRRRGIRSARIAGADLWLRLIERTAGTTPIYIVGSTPDVVAEAVGKLRRQFPAATIAGFRDGFLSPGEMPALATRLRASEARIVFVAMGSPRQELLMTELLAAWPALYVGLGGSLDVYCGRRRRAPRLVQRIGLEWAFRFVIDPKRLPRLPAYLRFAWLLATNRL